MIGQIWYAPTSPFARKVRIAAHELGLADALELVEVNPWTDARLRALNPLAKVPTLVLPSGETLYESGVICDYLDAIGAERRLFPPSGTPRWRALRLQGLMDGAMTAAGRLYADEQRPADQRSDAMMTRLGSAIASTLEALDREPLDPEALTIGEISAAAFLGYLDFRWPERDWRTAHPAQARWFAAVERRPSMIQTRHHP